MKELCNFRVKIEFNQEPFSWFSHTIGIHVRFSLQGLDPHFPLCRWTYGKLIVYGKTNWRKHFPSTLEDHMEVKKYASTFHLALSPILKELVDGDEHIMRVCSLLAIPPPPPGTPLRHIEIPMDLTSMSLPEWIDKIQDLATGMVVLPPTFLFTGGVVQSSMLPKLEKVSGVRACRFCLHPHTVCGCSQVPSWSHTSTRQSPATVTMAHSHSSTSMSASTKCPPPGLPPLGGTITSSTYSEALTFALPPQMQMRGVNHPPLPGGRYPAVNLCSGAPSPRMEATIRSEHQITLQDELRTPYQQQMQVPPILTTWSSRISREALMNLMKKRSKELEQQMTTPPTVGRGQGLSPRNVRMLPTKDNKNRREEEASLVIDEGNHLSKDNGASLLQDKEVVHLPALLLGFRGGTPTPDTLVNSGEKGGRKMPTRSMDGMFP